MALDFAVLGDNGSPERTVPCKAEVHHAVLKAASEHNLPLFQRLGDYYQDAEFSPPSLPTLVEEIRVLRQNTVSPEAQHFLESLDTLVAYAMHERSSVHVLAD